MRNYKERCGTTTLGQGSLVLKSLKANGTKYALIGYLPAGLDLDPHVFITGTIEDCRGAYRAAKSWMIKKF